jgi:hypothetical protein
MAKVKVTSRFKILELLDSFVDNATANDLGKTIVTEAKQNISEGLSPVRGYGRFERYKNPEKYPLGLPPGLKKNQRPVNLDLTGEMLAGYDYRLSHKKDTIEVGMVSGSAFAKEKAQYHNEGTPNMAQRKIVPDEGEEWSVSIMRKIRDLYSRRLEFLIRQANKKA